MAYIRCTKGHLENQPCAEDGGMQCPWCQLDDCMQYIDAMILDRDYFADELQKKEAENETNAKDAEELEAALKLSQEAIQVYCDDDKRLRRYAGCSYMHTDMHVCVICGFPGYDAFRKENQP